MKVIFLDIDGVLNCAYSKSHCCEYVGIDTAKIKLLKQIIDRTGAIVVLISSWKVHWNKRDKVDKYMRNKFNKGHIEIFSCTDDCLYDRGEGIYQWLDEHEVESWVVLDDEIFEDYDDNILKRLVRTKWDAQDGGLRPDDVDTAVSILNDNMIIANYNFNKPEKFVHVGLGG